MTTMLPYLSLLFRHRRRPPAAARPAAAQPNTNTNTVRLLVLRYPISSSAREP